MDGHIRSATAVVSLYRQNHVIMGSRFQSCRLPGLEMVSHCHDTLASFLLPYAENLPERGCPLNARFVDAHLSSNKVETPVTGQIAFLLTLWRCGRVMIWVVRFNNVVLDKRVGSPAINC